MPRYYVPSLQWLHCGFGTGVGVGVGMIEGVGVADADAVVFVVVVAVVVVVVAALDAACDGLLAAWLLLVDDVQPAIDNEVTITSTMITNNFFFTSIAPLTEK
jgi:hypothetical protein